jgi:hypothetical protein
MCLLVSHSVTPQEAIEMRFVGVVIQELWSEPRPRHEREHHRSRREEEPGSVRRLLPTQRSRRS